MQHRVKASFAVTGTYSRIIEGCSQKLFAQRFTLVIEIIDKVDLIFEKKGIMPVAAGIELSREDNSDSVPFITSGAVEHGFFFVYYPEVVVFSYLAEEIDIPGEDVGQLDPEVDGKVLLGKRSEERMGDESGSDPGEQVEWELLFGYR